MNANWHLQADYSAFISCSFAVHALDSRYVYYRWYLNALGAHRDYWSQGTRTWDEGVLPPSRRTHRLIRFRRNERRWFNRLVRR